MTLSNAQLAPRIVPLGQDALVIQLARQASDSASAAVQILLHELDRRPIAGCTEIVPALASVMVRFDPAKTNRADVAELLQAIVAQIKWNDLTLPALKRLWTIPVCVDDNCAPNLAQTAQIIGKSPDHVIKDLCSQTLRVLAIGFAPGQPYIGLLPQEWDMPRTSELTSEVPAGALVTAVRQLVLFANPSPTGWRQIGLTAFRPFTLGATPPAVLKSGDGIQFETVSLDQMSSLLSTNDPLGGATCKTQA